MEKEEIQLGKTPEEKENIRKLTSAFLTKRKGIIQKTNKPVEQLKEFVLLLMKNNGHSDFIEGVQAGEFYLRNGNQEKSILLTPNKLTTFNYNGQYFKGWVAHEDNMSPYPQDPLHNGEMFRKTAQKLAINYKDANEAKMLQEQRKTWLYIIGAIIVGGYILLSTGILDGLTATTATQTTTEAVKNVSIEAINKTGVMIV